MKLIFVVDRSAKGGLALAGLPFVRSHTELRQEELARLDPRQIAAVFLHRSNERERDWFMDAGVKPRFVIDEDFPEVAEVRGTMNLPRERYAARIHTFLQGYQASQQPDPQLFLMDDAAFARFAAEQAQVDPAPPRLRLRALRIQGVKATHDSQLIALPNPCVLVGRNGSGKSALLEALQWLQGALRENLTEATRPYHSLNDLRTRGATEIQVALDFSADRDPRRLSYELVVGADARLAPVVRSERCALESGEEISTPIEGGERQLLGGNPVSQPERLALKEVAAREAPGAASIRDFLQRAVFLRLSPRDLALPGPLQRAGGGPLLEESGADLAALLDELPESGALALLDNLQETLGPQVQAVTLERNPTLNTGFLTMDQRTGAGDPQRLPAWVLSEGTRRLAAIYAVLAAQPPPSLLALEEIENGLDPWTLSHVLHALRIAVAQGVQVVLTTHSPYFLDKFAPEEIIHVANEEGQARYRPITSYEDVMKYEGEIPPGVLYTEGYYRKPRW